MLAQMRELYAIREQERICRLRLGVQSYSPAVEAFIRLVQEYQGCLPGDVLLQNTLLLDIDRQKPGHGDAEFAQRFIVAQLGLQLVAERIVFARLVVELL